jgi:hypothetical protein
MDTQYGLETIESDNNLIGKMYVYSKESFKRITTAKGKLLNAGYIQCENSDYMKRGNQYARYLRSCGKLIFETCNQ